VIAWASPAQVHASAELGVPRDSGRSGFDGLVPQPSAPAPLPAPAPPAIPRDSTPRSKSPAGCKGSLLAVPRGGPDAAYQPRSRSKSLGERVGSSASAKAGGSAVAAKAQASPHFASRVERATGLNLRNEQLEALREHFGDAEGVGSDAKIAEHVFSSMVILPGQFPELS